MRRQTATTTTPKINSNEIRFVRSARTFNRLYYEYRKLRTIQGELIACLRRIRYFLMCEPRMAWPSEYEWLQAKRMNFVEYRNVIHLYTWIVDTARLVAASAIDTYVPRTFIIKTLKLIIHAGAANIMVPFELWFPCNTQMQSSYIGAISCVN